MEAERSSIFIHDEASGTLWNRVSGTLARGQVRIPLGTGIVGHVGRTGQPLNVPDAYVDPRFNPEVDKETGFRTHSILAAPLTGHSGKLIGVVQVLNKRGRRAFDGDDEELLLAFASHAALALDRARLIEAFVEKQRIEEGLRLAHEIQMSMLPGHFPTERGLELAAELRPARSVGGDLYDALVQGDRLWFLVGDVAGKGVASALFMAVAQTLFRASVQGEPPLPVVLSRMNRALCRNNERAMFVTLFAGCLDLLTGELLTGNAGHNPPYHLKRDGSLTPLSEPRGVPLGLIEAYEYPMGYSRLEPGDGLFLYTDGVTEALDHSDEQFSQERLESWLGEAGAASATELVEGVLAAVGTFVGSTAPSDDVTVMAIRYRALPRGPA
jgi:serine phosphatase RsbU (regulator of sigma subunit)